MPRIIRGFVAFAGISLGLRAGIWQLDRADQKDALARQVEQAAALPALDGPSFAALIERDARAAAHRHIQVRGEWLPSPVLLLSGRSMGRAHGYVVLAPFRIEGMTDAVLVQRGFVAVDAARPSEVPVIVPPPQGPTALLGRVAPLPGERFTLGEAPAVQSPLRPSGGPIIRQNLDLSIWPSAVPERARQLTVLQTQPATADGLQRDWPLQLPGREKHIGYAFQWFSLAALVFFLYVWFEWVRPRWRGQQTAAGG